MLWSKKKKISWNSLRLNNLEKLCNSKYQNLSDEEEQKNQPLNRAQWGNKPNGN